MTVQQFEVFFSQISYGLLMFDTVDAETMGREGQPYVKMASVAMQPSLQVDE